MKLYHGLNAPSIPSLKGWLQKNMAKNVPISYEDVKLAQKIFLADVATCKGKSTAPRPPVVTTEDVVELPDKLKHEGEKVELTIYVVCIND